MKKRMLRILSLALCCAMLFAIAACGGSNPTPTPTSAATATPAPGDEPTQPPAPPEGEAVYAETVSYVHSVGIGLLNSHDVAGDGIDHNGAIRMVFDTLYYNEPDGTSIPMVATSYETEDYQTWVFHLRDDVYFHNGEKLTANDVVFTWKHAVEEGPASIAASNWGWIEEATAIDDYTVEFKTEKPYANLPFNVGINVSNILCEKAMLEDPVGGLLIGSGAYKILEFEPGDHILFERNEDFWGELPNSKFQRWTYVSEASVRAIMLQNGTAQLGGVAAPDMPMFENNPDFGLHQYAANNSQGLLFNLGDDLCSDLNFRLAVKYAIDIYELSDFAFPAFNVPVEDGAIWGYKVPYKNTDIPFEGQDIEKAKEFLADSKYNGETVNIATSAVQGSGAMDMLIALVEQLAVVGIKAEINAMDNPTFAVYTNPVNNQSQMSIFFARLSQNPVDTYRVNFYPGSSNNRSNYDNPEVTKLMDEVSSIVDEDEAKAVYYKMQEIVTADCPLIPIYWMPSTMIYANGVSGFKTSPSAMQDLRYFCQVIEE